MFSAHYLFATLHLWIAVARGSSTSDSCYYIPLPDLPVSKDNRTVPWGEPTIKYSDGTTCCSSLDQIRNELDAIDSQLLQLLSIRYVCTAESSKAGFHGKLQGCVCGRSHSLQAHRIKCKCPFAQPGGHPRGHRWCPRCSLAPGSSEDGLREHRQLKYSVRGVHREFLHTPFLRY